jgi:hypothetical protein
MLSCLLVKAIIHKGRSVLFLMDMAVHRLPRSLDKRYVKIWCHKALQPHIYGGKQQQTAALCRNATGTEVRRLKLQVW